MVFHKTLLRKISYEVSLYIHIPFCTQKCRYCDFFSIPCTSQSAGRIIREIIHELEYFSHHPGDVKIKTIYIGGGTPSVLPINLIKTLFTAITALPLDHLREFTVEANPESLTREFLLLCKEFYVTRISLGIQTTDDRFLSLLGRGANLTHIIKARDLVAGCWEGDLNVDLITGIPGNTECQCDPHGGQTKKMVKADIDYCIHKFHPDHISLYSLTFEPGTILFKLREEKKIQEISPEDADSLWFYGHRLLESNNYGNYEISNFALPGKESRHNLQYWRLGPYLGIGPGAVSTLPGTQGSILRLNHQHDLDTYVGGADTSWGIDCEEITPGEFLFETCMMGFRLKQGIHKKTFIRRFGTSLPDMVPGLWKKWEADGWINESPFYYALTDNGRFLLHTLLVELAEALDHGKIKLSLVQWPETL